MSHWIAEGKTYDVEEYCPYCDEMIPIIIDLGCDHFWITCPHCGRKTMLCSVCPDVDRCDWNPDTGCHKDDHEDETGANENGKA